MNDLQQTTTTPHTAQEIPQRLYEPEPPNFAHDPHAKGPAASPTKEHQQQHPSAIPVCAICSQGIQVGMPVKQLCCAHLFHAFCVDQWLRSELHCPICKTQVLFPVVEAFDLHAGRADRPTQQQPHYHQHTDIHKPVAVPLDGTDSRLYANCRDCQRVFYRDPKAVRPETSAWYRCPECRGGDIFDLVRSSCVLQ